jgi:hypothetical protein
VNGLLIKWMEKESMPMRKFNFKDTLKMITLSDLWIDFHHHILYNLLPINLILYQLALIAYFIIKKMNYSKT